MRFEPRRRYEVTTIHGEKFTGFCDETHTIGWRHVTVYKTVYRMLTAGSTGYMLEEPPPAAYHFGHYDPIAEVSAIAHIVPLDEIPQSKIQTALHTDGTWWKLVKIKCVKLPPHQE